MFANAPAPFFTLGSAWTADLGTLTVGSNTATSDAGVDLAHHNFISAAHPAVSALINVGGTGEHYGAVVSELDPATLNMYVAMLGINTSADPRAAVLLWRFQPGTGMNGGWTLLNFSYVHPGEFSGVLRMEVVGGVEKAYLNGELWATDNDTRLSKGPVGFQNFSASFIQAASDPNFSDTFNRQAGTWLGSPWSVDIGGFGLSSPTANPFDTVSLASLYGYSQNDVVVSANVDVSGVASNGQVYSS
jgi:hypothetical protein